MGPMVAGFGLGVSPLPALYLLVTYLPNLGAFTVHALMFGWIAASIILGLFARERLQTGWYVGAFILGLVCLFLFGSVMIIGIMAGCAPIYC